MMSPLLILRSGRTKDPRYLYGMRRLFVAMMNNSEFLPFTWSGVLVVRRQYCVTVVLKA